MESLKNMVRANTTELAAVGNRGENLLFRHIFGQTAMHAIQSANRHLFLAQ